MALEHEMETYRRELPRLLDEGEQGRFALVVGDQIDSIWDTRRDAVQAGHQCLAVVPFLVKQVEREEPPALITRFLVPNAPGHTTRPGRGTDR